MRTAQTFREGDSYLYQKYASVLSNIDISIQNCLSFYLKHFTNPDTYELELVMRELLNNAVLHGNKNQENLFFRCLITIREYSLSVYICDEGVGFDWLKAAAKKKYTLKPGGRGLSILQSSGFHFSYNKTGNRVLITKEIQQL